MMNTPRVPRFESRVLRPTWVAVIAAGIFCAYSHAWWSLGGSVVLLLFLGAIGSRLHPLTTASELSHAQRASIESNVLPADVQVALVSRACTQVALVLSGAFAWVLLAWLHWHSYVALPLAYVAVLVIGAPLKLAFARP